MIARKIRPEEVKRTEELFSVCFDYSYDVKDTPEALYEKYSREPKSRDEENCLERFAAFEEDDKTMMSCFVMQPLKVQFDDHEEAMVGIGGVSTLPQYRKRGGIRACFEAALPHMYEQGAAFSYLYPFSTAYYRKFGYELCCNRMKYKLALSHIPAYSVKGSCYLLDSGTADKALADIPDIYDKWQKKYNMMVKTSPYDLNAIERTNPYKDQIFTYVYRTEEGKASAFMTFKSDTCPDKRILQCSHFYFTDREGLKGLLTLAKSFAADYRHISFYLPEDVSLEAVMAEWSMGAVSREVESYGMVRAVNVKQILMDALYKGTGRIALQIRDEYILENNGVFEVIYQDGTCIGVTKYEGEPDITLGIAEFSALITGCHDLDWFSMWDTVIVRHGTEQLKNIFYKKKILIDTYF